MKSTTKIKTIGDVEINPIPDFAKDRFIKPDIFEEKNVEVKPEINEGELIKKESSVMVDPNTGMNKIVSDKVAYDGAVDVAATDIKPIAELGETNIETDDNKEILEMYGIRDEDMKTMYDLIRDYDKGITTTNLYSKLPPSMKLMCASSVGSRKPSELNAAAKTFIHELHSQFYTNKEFIDLQKSINEEIAKLGDIGEVYDEYEAERMDKLDMVAEKYKEEGNMEKYQKIMDIKIPRDEAISFSRLKEAAHNIKRLDKVIRQYDKVCRDFNYKYKTNKTHEFTITDVRSIGLVLKRHLHGDKYTEEDVMKFVALFCKLCLNYNADEIKDHSFMYYTIRQVNLLDVYLRDNDKYKAILANIEEVINIIREEEAKRFK